MWFINPESGVIMRLIALLIVFITSLPSFATTINYPVSLGGTTINIQQTIFKTGKTFIHLHQNENTALLAAKKYIKEYGGSLITLKHKGTRNITFTMHRKHYEFDPNRIYTDAGIKATLNEYGNYDKPAHLEVRKLAKKISSLLPKGKIIAVHNNENYSFKNYFPGHKNAKDAALLNSEKKRFYRNFFLVTRKQEHKRLANKRFNSILQSTDAEDDGSLSILLKDRNYINIEAGYNQLKTQINMIKNA